MAKKRVHELAKQHGMSSKDVLAKLTAAGIEVKAPASAVDEAQAIAALTAPNGAPPAAAGAPTPSANGGEPPAAGGEPPAGSPPPPPSSAHVRRAIRAPASGLRPRPPGQADVVGS